MDSLIVLLYTHFRHTNISKSNIAERLLKLKKMQLLECQERFPGKLFLQLK